MPSNRLTSHPAALALLRFSRPTDQRSRSCADTPQIWP